MKKRFLSALILVFLVLNTLISVEVSVASYGSSSDRYVEKVDSQSTLSFADGTGLLTVYTASGKTENLSLPFDKGGLTAVSYGNNTSIFINDLMSGKKVDLLLANCTMLKEEGYLDEGKVKVIALTGDMLTDNTYRMRMLSELETVTLTQIAQNYNITILSRSTVLPYVTLEIPYEKVMDFARLSMISHVFLDRKHRVCLNESIPIIKSPEKWEQIEFSFGFKINGSGMKIAILDTGIDSTHPDLQGKVVLERCFTDEGKTSDGFGHGTHCAGIAAGTGVASNGVYVGVAPCAVLLNGKVLTDDGWGYDSWIINGITWAVQEGAHVISMSFDNAMNGPGTDPMSITVDWATDQGVVCVAAAGNEGWSGMSSVGSPGIARKAITVGAKTKTDFIAGFSSQGPTTDLRLKPDVCAPGVDIIAARASGTSMGSPVNECYTMASGTSMATPHVAGAAALIRQAHPDWSPVKVKSALMGNAKALSNERLWREGAGRIDVADATNTTLLVIEPSASLGSMGSHSLTWSFIIVSTVGYQQNVNLATFTTCGGIVTDYVTLNVSSLTLPAYGIVGVKMTVEPLDYNAPEGWYEGWFQVAVGNRIYNAPYLFMAVSTVKVLMYDVDNSTRIDAQVMLTSYPKLKPLGWSFCTEWPDWAATFLCTSGNYSVCATSGWILNGFTIEGGRTFMLQKVISVPKFSTIFVRLSLAEATVSEIPTIDSYGRNLIVHAYSQYFSGDNTHDYYNGMSWSMQFFYMSDLNISKIIFYSSRYSPADELSEAFCLHASDDVMSEVYLLSWKYWNKPTLPPIWKYETSNLAKYKVYYNMPEAYPQNGIWVSDMIWFTWYYMPWHQVWFIGFYKISVGIEATYYMTPLISWYDNLYMLTYWPVWRLDGPLQQWTVGSFDLPPQTGETGSKSLGRFNFGPYIPGLSLQVTPLNEHSIITLSGDLWANLKKPRSWVFNQYPPWSAYYYLYVDGILFAEGSISCWTGISNLWTVVGQRALLQVSMPSLGTISKQTVYSVNFSLTENLNLPSFFSDLPMPLNYYSNQSIIVWPKIVDTSVFHVSNVSLFYSFNDGSTWYVAMPLSMTRFSVPCQASEKLAIMVKALDDRGNSFEYCSNPVALSKEVEVSVDVESLIYIEAKTMSGSPIPSVALKIDTLNGSFYVALDSAGKATLSSTIGLFRVWFPMVGLYAKTLGSKPDVAVVDISLSSNEVYIKRIVNVSVTVKNCGTFFESFSVKVYCNDSLFGTTTVSELYPGMSSTLTFSLDTTGLVPYINYTIRAEVSVVPYEVNVTNNVLIKGKLIVRAVGDVNNDRTVDIFDIILIAAIYGWKEGDPYWNSFADLAPEFGKIDILDLVTCASHYGEKYP